MKKLRWLVCTLTLCLCAALVCSASYAAKLACVDTQSRRIFTVDLSTGKMTVVAMIPGARSVYPYYQLCWSNDGKSLLYTMDATNPSTGVHDNCVFCQKIGRGKPELLSTGRCGNLLKSGKLLFASDSGVFLGNYILQKYLMPEPTLLVVSPDERRYAVGLSYDSDSPGYPAEIMYCDMNGSVRRDIKLGKWMEIHWLDLTDTKLVYIYYEQGGGVNGFWQTVVMDLATGKKQIIPIRMMNVFFESSNSLIYIVSDEKSPYRCLVKRYNLKTKKSSPVTSFKGTDSFLMAYHK